MISDLLRCHPERGWWSGGQSKDLLGTIEHRKKILRLPARPPTHAQDDTPVHSRSTGAHAVICFGMMLFAAVASAAPSRGARARPAHQSRAARGRASSVSSTPNGGATAELLDALTEAFEGVRAKQTLPFARAFATLVERLAREHGQLRAQSRALSGIGATYVTERRAAEAESYFQQAYAVGQALRGRRRTGHRALQPGRPAPFRRRRTISSPRRLRKVDASAVRTMRIASSSLGFWPR